MPPESPRGVVLLLLRITVLDRHWQITTLLHQWAPECPLGLCLQQCWFKVLVFCGMALFLKFKKVHIVLPISWWFVSKWLFLFQYHLLFSPIVGSVCCSYAGHHTNCREYCQAIFRTDSSPGPSQIKAVENYCASISPQLIHCVNNYTQSYPMRNPTDSK